LGAKEERERKEPVVSVKQEDFGRQDLWEPALESGKTGFNSGHLKKRQPIKKAQKARVPLENIFGHHTQGVRGWAWQHRTPPPYPGPNVNVPRI